MIVNLLAEGYMEEVVASKLVPFCNHELGIVYGKRGCKYIREKATKFRHLATKLSGLLILTDFRDTKEDCVPSALQMYILNELPNPPSNFLCRFAVNELESWLMADREGLATYMGIDISLIPFETEEVDYPKRTIVNLAQKSRKKVIRNGIAPPPEHRAEVGPEYMLLLRDFIINYWNIEAAMLNSPSLRRCIQRLRELGQGL